MINKYKLTKKEQEIWNKMVLRILIASNFKVMINHSQKIAKNKIKVHKGGIMIKGLEESTMFKNIITGSPKLTHESINIAERLAKETNSNPFSINKKIK